MIAALAYLQYHSARNRLIMRFKRLKQPKYLFGAIAGGAYLYFYFFRYLFRNYGNHAPVGNNFLVSPENMLLYESVAALALFIIVVLAWIIPHDRAALTFTEAEVAFLFPAPVTRRTLIHFKLVRSQLRILFSALLLTLFSRRFGGNPWAHAFGWWLILSTLNLHFLGASFARTLWLDRGLSNWLRRLLVFIVVAAAAACVWVWAKKTVPPPTSDDLSDIKSILNYAGQILNAGPALYLLYPFRVIVQPFFARDAAMFFSALILAAPLFLLHYFWVAYSDVKFEEASIEASQKLATRVAARRSGNWQGANQNKKAQREWFRLKAIGAPMMALLWKNLIGVGQIFSARLLMVIVVVCVIFFIGFGQTARAQNISVIGDLLIAIVLGYSLMLGPQLLRLDFRRDLPQADVLKTFPLRGWQIALGEILAPVIMLMVFQWLLLLIGFGLALFLPGKYKILAWAIGLGAVCLLPMLDFLLLLIPNAAVLMFPSWVQMGKDSPRGIEATGQRIIFAVGQLLILLLALIPAALAFAAIYFSMKFSCGPIIPLPFASLAAAIIIAVEGGLGVRLLGKLFERFDVTEESAN